MEIYSIDERKDDLEANIRFLQELKAKRDAEPDRNSETFRNYSLAIGDFETAIAYAHHCIERDTKHIGGTDGIFNRGT